MKPTEIKMWHHPWGVVNTKRLSFKGLSLSSDDDMLLNANSSSDIWFFSVGYNTAWGNDDPAWITTRGAETKTELFAFLPGKPTFHKY